ncbi:MAG TPA: sigma-54 dependent transcriptional regulator [Thermoanaerobaculia bacterium]|jgi:DNA-binding NtrC family response regulator|nr:sigma-54 dependent transcriptional regulator [Thermoanaerobaculia bacterium]
MTETAVRQRLLIVDDDVNVVAGLEALLADEWEVKTATTARDGRAVFADFSPDVVLLDMNLPDGNGVDVLHDLKMYSEAVSVIMMSGVGTIDSVVESMKLGAETFLQKPFDYSMLSLTLEQVSRIVGTRRELIALRRGDSSDLERLPGISPSVQNLNELLAQIARAPSPVLIEGDSGTGKGVYARLIHNRSPRARAPFVDLNCAGLSKELLESELFGHERGAFTNAMNTKQGLFEIASDGTLFLDEIGDMDVTVQARLLKAIEEKRFRRVGGVRDLTTNFRLIAATNRDLGKDVAAGRFRGDLYYRLNVVRVRMPLLRERPEDIPLLVEVILRPLAKEMGRSAPPVSARALKRLAAYPWPGNVRELRNVLERAMLTMTGKEIRSEDLLLESDPASMPNTSGGLPTADWEIRPLDEMIDAYITASVSAAGGNVRKAARQLQISPSTLYARMNKKSG